MSRSIRIMCVLLLVTPSVKFAVNGELVTLATVATIAGVASTVIKIAKDGTSVLKSTVRYLSEDPETLGPKHEKHFNAEHDQLLDHLRSLAKVKYEIKTDVENMKEDMLSQMFRTLPGLVELNNRLTKVFVHVDSVDSYYETFVAYYEKLGRYNRDKVVEFANSVTSDTRHGLNHLLDDIHKYLVRGYGVVPSSLTLLARNMQVFVEANQIPMSPQQLVYDLLLSVMYTELKAFFTIRYSYEVLNLYGHGNFSTHIEKTEYDFGRRVNNTLSTFQQLMKNTSREVSKNNPPAHVEGKTYTELKNVFQEFVINEKDISNDQDCSASCSDYSRPFRKNLRSCSYKGEVCNARFCDGSLHDCRFKVDTDMSICISGQNSSRYYEFIDYNDGLRYGDRRAECSTARLQASRKFEFSKWWCDPCFCVCADNTPKSERHFSLDLARTNAQENYVITGARFAKRKNMMHIQIREGQLLPNGRINASTSRWSKINDSPAHYYTLQWEEGREINFDELKVPRNYVLTGLSFASGVSDSRTYTRRLHLTALAAPLYYHDGVLNLRHEQQFVNHNLFSSKRIDIENRDVPTRTGAPTNLRSGDNEYLRFTHTGLDGDVGQSTVPFIDIQEVTTDPPVPMNSAGVFFRSRADNGGFVALKLLSYDYSQHMAADLPNGYKDFGSL